MAILYLEFCRRIGTFVTTAGKGYFCKGKTPQRC